MQIPEQFQSFVTELEQHDLISDGATATGLLYYSEITFHEPEKVIQLLQGRIRIKNLPDATSKERLLVCIIEKHFPL